MECRICGRSMYRCSKFHRNQRVHIACVEKEPFDLIINNGTFHCEVHSELLTPKQLKKLIKYSV